MRAKDKIPLCESSFLKFCYGPKRKPLPKESLTGNQAIVYNSLTSGLTVLEVVAETGLAYSMVHSYISCIKKKGWLV